MEIGALTRIFSTLDANSDGKISTKEMNKAIKNGLDDDTKSLFDGFINDKGKLDKKLFKVASNGDSKLSLKEFTDLFGKLDSEDNVTVVSDEQNQANMAIIEQLAKIDKNSNGKLTASEINKAYKKAKKENDTEMLELLKPYMTTNKKGDFVADKELLKYLGDGKSYLTYTSMLSFDSDNNGKLNENESGLMSSFQNNFYQLDFNKDGKISQNEMLKAYNNEETDSALKEMLGEFISVNDKGKAKIDKEVFKTISGGKNYLTRTTFENLNTSTDTNVSTDEVSSSIKGSAEFMKLDLNDDGKVTLSEIKKYAEENSDSEFANLINGQETNKEKKSIFNMFSDGDSYLTAAELSILDADKNGSISKEELSAFV